MKTLTKNFIFSYAAIHTVYSFTLYNYKVGLRLLIFSFIFAFCVVVLPYLINKYADYRKKKKAQYERY